MSDIDPLDIPQSYESVDNPQSYQAVNIPGASERRASVNSVTHFASSFTRAQSFLAIDRPDIARTFYEEGADLEEESLREYESVDETSMLLPLHKPTSRRPSFAVPIEMGTRLLEEAEIPAHGTESEPVIVRKVEDAEGHIMTMIMGQSTSPQTIFNSVNVLMGVGMLSLPLGFKYAGWVIGTIALVLCGFATFVTAILLAKCQDIDPTLVTYADIAYAAFGKRGRLLVSIMFTIELLGSGVSLIVLFADSLNALYPEISIISYKLIAFALLTPLTILPLRILSITSVLGILCTIGLIGAIVFDGLYKTQSPGSLLDPMPTWLWPQNWFAVPLTIGIFMAPWGGHAVFPNIYRDMRHPQHYKQCLYTIYELTFTFDLACGVLGFLMFGRLTSDEINNNIVLTEGYPQSVVYLITLLVGIIPLAKTPLTARPIISTIDVLTGLQRIPIFHSARANKHGATVTQRIAKFFIRIGILASFVGMATIFPDFDRIIAFAGSAFCITTCLMLPIAFYLKLYGHQLTKAERAILVGLFILFGILAVVGTVWALLPRRFFR
ncbi:vacuolar amino acid transporter 1 [Trichomonascus vanleenenianus]|uniref:Avt1p n=1 Tax=Trichomonascus vanleenenianus TaxID=2268995 RepID=UPI003EC9DEC1